jgi:hypothetical protein
MAIGQPGALAIKLQHLLLRLAERLSTERVVGAGVLQSWAEAADEELRRDLVVLRVGRVGVDGDRAVPQKIDYLLIALGSPGTFCFQARDALTPDGASKQGIRNPTALCQP